MDLEKGKITKNLDGVTPLSYQSTNENSVTTSTANLYSSYDSSSNDITNGDNQQLSSSEKDKNSCKYIMIAKVIMVSQCNFMKIILFES